MATFKWVRNPTLTNTKTTWYVSHRGLDSGDGGDGSATNPFRTIAQVTSVAIAGDNIMLDDGVWSQQRTLNNRAFIWWGNGVVIIDRSIINFTIYNTDILHFIEIKYGSSTSASFYNCRIRDWTRVGDFFANGERNIFINAMIGWTGSPKVPFRNNIVINSNMGNPNYVILATAPIHNNVFIGGNGNINGDIHVDNNNYTTNAIPTTNGANANSINDVSTGQTVADYFNNYDIGDYTAKVGSANIGAGEKGTTIGFNQGYTMYADNSANDVFKESNGATLKNIAWDSTLNGYTLVQKERICQGATSNEITLDSSASSEDDYYNNLFVGIVAGGGYGELFLITDYDGTTKTATIDGTWTTTPNANSIYTISGTILSATKDLGKAIKVKRNWTFADNFTALTDGQWAEFMTHVETNGKQFPVSCYSYEYSTDGVSFIQGQTADDLVSAINGENKVTDAIYGDCSANYDEATAKNLIMQYIRVRVHIGFNIGQIGE